MRRRRVNTLFAILLLTTALVVTLSNYTVPPLIKPLPEVQGNILPVAISFFSPPKFGDNVLVIGTGPASVPAGTLCTITGNQPNIVTSGSGIVPPSLNAFGTFFVGNGAAPPGSGPVTVTLTCGADSGTASFTVNPLVAVTPSVGSATLASVAVSGVGFASDATSCTLSSSPGGLIMSQVCGISGGSLTGGTSFTIVAAAANGLYDITVTPNAGLTGTGKFKKTPVGTPDVELLNTLQFSLSLKAGPSHAPPGYGTMGGTSNQVQVTGGGFPTNGVPRACTITPGGALVFAASACTIDTLGTVTATFAVDLSSTPGGPYSVTITDSCCGGMSAATSPSFTVDPIPTIGLSPGSGAAGTTVVVTGGSGYSSLDAGTGTCTISSSPGGLISSSFCQINFSGNILAVQFSVSSTAAGQTYKVILTGSHGDPSASPGPAFVVTPAVTITSPSPAQGSPPLGALPGTTVGLTGTGFALGDTSCTFSSAPSNIVGAQSCTINPSTGVLSGSFVVASGALFGAYTLGATGNAGCGTDCANPPSPFNVIPRIVLNPTFGTAGTFVVISGSGFKDGGGGPCVGTIDGVGGALITGIVCTDSGLIPPKGVVAGSFTVGAVPDATYTISITGVGGDTASALFVKGAAGGSVNPHISLSPVAGVAGTVVAVSGYGFSPGAISCTISSAPSGLFASTPGCGISGTSTTTSISTTTSTTTSTSVSTTTSQTVQTTTITTTTTSLTTSFTSQTSFITTGQTIVTAFTTTSGTSTITTATTVVSTFTSVTVYSVTTSTSTSTSTTQSTTTSTTSSTSLSTLTSTTQTTSSTTITQTLVAGSFQVAPGALAGVYVVKLTDNLGASASASFTVGTPAATIAVSPSYASPGDTVSFTGTGFSLADTSCTVSVPNVIAASPVPTCNITGGNLAGSFTVKSGATPGISNIVVTGSSGDFASAELDVIVTTTGVSTTTTTTTSSSSTTTSTTTSTTFTSTSFSTSSVTTTGPTTQVFTHGVLTTVSGESTATSSTTVTLPTTTTASGTTTTTTTTTHTFGQAVQPSLGDYYPDAFGLLAMLSLVVPMLVRRLVS